MSRTTRIAWHDLAHRRSRTLAALGGVLFAIVLIFMQLGFYFACRASSIRVHDLFDFDIALTSPSYSFIVKSDQFHRRQLQQAAAIEGIERVAPVRIGASLWNSNTRHNRYDNVVVGIDPTDAIFALPEIARQQQLLQQLDTVLYDSAAHPLQGHNPPGTSGEITAEGRVRGRQVEVVGNYHWGAGFVANGIAITSEQTFTQLFPERSPDDLQLGLVQLAPGAAVSEVKRQLRQRLPPDVKIWSRSELEAKDRYFFLRHRPIGLMFTSGVALAVLVGGMILFQVLASEVTSRRHEFATLQAIGYSPSQVYRVVVEQGLFYTLIAFLPATLIALALFQVTRQVARLPMHLDVLQLLLVLAASLVMCVSGALLASRKVRSADPADLF